MSVAVDLLGAPPVAAAARWLTRRRLRVLTYHRVPDAAAFARQLDYIGRHFATITGDAVIEWLDGRADLPRRPLWITFDDGDPSVVDVALPLLMERSMVATAFVCPGLVDTDRPHWWDIVAHGEQAGLTRPGSVARLKRVPDDDRRAAVATIQAGLIGAGAAHRVQWSSADIHRWVRAGNQVANHTWDHPCLDRCSPAEQDRQVRRAHEALTELLDAPPRVFAWPNGNVADAAQQTLQALGYGVVMPCDHRLVARRAEAAAISRLRIDSDAGLPRARAIISGAHSGVFGLVQRVRRVREVLGGS